MSSKSLVGSSQKFQRKPKPRTTPSLSVTSDEVIVHEGKIYEGGVTAAQRKLIIEQRARGKTYAELVERFKVDEETIHRIEEEYYSSQQSLSEHAMLMKQLSRLDMLLDVLYERVLGDQYDLNPDFLKHALAVISEISDLAGLKKQRIAAEIKIIEQQQVPLIVSFNDRVVESMLARVQPLLTKRGALELETKKTEWMSESVKDAAEILDSTTPMRA